ncbi:MAG TPA: DNA topoisomerase I, partial [Trueperaceae bacterium]|nr:DNA topoisomerase I [Trueperaceae bacterium]
VGIEARLYDLIWKRTVASQMQNAKLKFTTATINVDKARFRASGRTTIFPGFFRAYVEGSDDPNQALDNQEQPLPALSENENLKCKEIAASGHETKPPARFTEASLIKLLEKEGIGRPSTYASIIDTILRRNYSYKSGNQLVPTFTSFAVTRLMEQQFDRLVDTNFTALMEKKLDDIADGSLKSVPYLKEFYFGDKGLKARVEAGLDAIDARATSELSFKKWGDFVIRVGRYGPYAEGVIDGELKTASIPDKIAPSEIDEAYLAKLITEGRLSEVVAKFPETGEPILLRKGPYGPYLQLGEDESKKPKRISLPKGLEPEDVDAKKAIELISLPRILGENPENGETIKAHIGRFGPYVQEKRVFASIPKEEDLLTISLERALELINQKKNKNKPLRVLGLHPETNEEVDVRDGRYGPYVKHQKTNASLKKDQTVEDINLEQALILLAEREEAKGTKKTKRKATKRKTTKKTAKKSTKRAVKKKPKK